MSQMITDIKKSLNRFFSPKIVVSKGADTNEVQSSEPTEKIKFTISKEKSDVSLNELAKDISSSNKN